MAVDPQRSEGARTDVRRRDLVDENDLLKDRSGSLLTCVRMWCALVSSHPQDN